MKLITVLVTAALAGCAADGKSLDIDALIPVSVQPDNFCQVARKVRWSVNDTKETIDQARRHNARWDRLCGNRATS